MNIGGYTKFSLVDFPGCVSAAVFTQGCNMRCKYCHNPSLVYPEQFTECIPETDILDFLKTRIGKLDGVVITGGEPTLQHDILDFIFKIRALGFKVKLDTNGTNPDLLRHVLKHELVDYIAMDVKAPLDKYIDIIGPGANTKDILSSIQMLVIYNLPHQFRVTYDTELLSEKDLRMIRWLVHPDPLVVNTCNKQHIA